MFSLLMMFIFWISVSAKISGIPSELIILFGIPSELDSHGSKYRASCV